MANGDEIIQEEIVQDAVVTQQPLTEEVDVNVSVEAPPTFEERLSGFAQQAQGVDAFQEDVFRQGVQGLRDEFNQQFGDVQQKLQDKRTFIDQTLFRQPVGKVTDIGQGFTLRKEADTPRDERGRSFNQISLVGPGGEVVKTITHTDSGSTRDQLTSALSEATGFGFVGQSGLSSREIADRAAQMVGDLGLATTRELAGRPDIQAERGGEAGFELAVQNRARTAGISEDEARAAILRDQQIQERALPEGVTPPLEREPEAQFQAAIQEGPADPFAGLQRIASPDQLAGLTEADIVRDPNSDAIYLRGQVNADTRIPTGEVDVSGLPQPRNLTEITEDTPRFQLRQITENLANQNGNNVLADEQFVRSTFKALHGRDANAGELSEFMNKGQRDVYNAIKAGVPKFDQGDLASFTAAIQTEDPRLDVDTGTGEVISGTRKTPGDVLGQFGGDIANQALTDIDNLLLKFFQGDATGIQGRLGEARAEEEGLKGELIDIKDSSFLEDKARELFGDGSRIGEIQDFLKDQRGRIEREILSKDLGLSQLGDQPIASGIILGQKRVLQEQAVARIGALTAASQAALGEGNLAIQTADRIMSAIKGDRDNQIDALNDLLSLANQDKIRLEDDEKDNIDQQINLLQDANDRMEDEKKDLQSLVLDNPLVAAAAGVSLSDTLDEAIGKIQAGAADKSSEVFRLMQLTSGGRGRGGAGGAGAAPSTADTLVGLMAQDIIDLEKQFPGNRIPKSLYDQKVQQLVDSAFNGGVSFAEADQALITAIQREKGEIGAGEFPEFPGATQEEATSDGGFFKFGTGDGPLERAQAAVNEREGLIFEGPSENPASDLSTFLNSFNIFNQ